MGCLELVVGEVNLLYPYNSSTLFVIGISWYRNHKANNDHNIRVSVGWEWIEMIGEHAYSKSDFQASFG